MAANTIQIGDSAAAGERAQELGPEGFGLGGADCYAEHLAPAIAVDGNRDDHCYPHDTTVLADLHVGRIDD